MQVRNNSAPTSLTRFLISALALSASLAFGQLDNNSITVTASRSVELQGDEVVFDVGVMSGLDTNFDNIVNALAGSGIAAANFTGVQAVQPVYTNPRSAFAPQVMIEWQFTLTAPLSNMKQTTAMLAGLQQNISKNNSGLTLSFDVSGTQVSDQLLQMQGCTYADLLSDAMAQARSLASAAGFSLGAVLSMSSTTGSAASNSTLGIGGFLTPTCTMTVKFAATRIS